MPLSSETVLCKMCVILLLSQLWVVTQRHNAFSVEVCRSLRCSFAVRICKCSQPKLLGLMSLEHAKPHGGEHSIGSCSVLPRPYLENLRTFVQLLQRRFPDVVFESAKNKKRSGPCVSWHLSLFLHTFLEFLLAASFFFFFMLSILQTE